MRQAPVLMLSMMLSLTGCVSERVILLPSKDGHPSAVTVRNENGEILLAAPYEQGVQRSGYFRVKPAKAALIQQRYAPALNAQPQRERRFMLFFETASDMPAADSLLTLEQIKSEIAGRPAAEIVIIGHTDRVGSEDENEALSARRVESVRTLLIDGGIEAARIDTAYRGEREPLVATPDGVSDPVNRRVEISVR